MTRDDAARVVAEQAAVGAHRHLGPPLGDRDRDRDRRALDAQELARDLRDHVAVLLPHVADGGDAHPARDLLVAEGGAAVGEPLGGHAVVAQLVQDVLGGLVAGQELEHLEVERRRAVQEGARVRVDAEGGGRAARGPDALEHVVEGRGDDGHERRGRAHGQPDEGVLHPLHARASGSSPPPRPDRHGGRPRRSTPRRAALRPCSTCRGAARCRPCSAARAAGGRRSGPRAASAAALDELPVLGMAEAAREEAHLVGAEVLEDGLQHHRAAERVRIGHPLGEDVGAAAADGLGAALQAHVGAVGLGQDGQDLSRSPLAEDRPEARDHDRGAGQPGRALQDVPVLALARPPGPCRCSCFAVPLTAAAVY